MESPTIIISKVLVVEPQVGVHQISNTPKFLWIRAQTADGPLALQLSETDARVLMEELQQYEKVRGFQR